MTGINSFLTVLMGIVITALPAFAQVPSPLKDIAISATVAIDNGSAIYKYNYKIFNPSINNEQIYYVGIDISKPPQSQELSSKDLIVQVGTNPRGVLLNRTFDEEIGLMGSLLQKPVIPIGTQIPRGWSSGLDAASNAMWGGNENNLVRPGQSLEGVMIISFGLPGIRDAFVKPVIDYDKLPQEYYENVELTKQLQDSLIYRTKTIGPTAPPADFKPLDFLNYIIDLKHQSTSLGWIKDKGIEQSLDSKLDNAKQKIEQGNTIAAKNILEAFINEVEAQKDKHLTSEAYGLLKYNVQYLMEKL